MVVFGVFAQGYPALFIENAPEVSILGQLVGAIVTSLCGFIPGYLLSLGLSGLGMLRTPEAAEIAGLDTTKVPAQAFPEGIPASAQPAE